MPVEDIENALKAAAKDGIDAVGQTIDDIINGIGGFFEHAKNEFVGAADVLGLEINTSVVSLLGGLEALMKFDEDRFVGWIEGQAQALEHVKSDIYANYAKYGMKPPQIGSNGNITAIGNAPQNETDIDVALQNFDQIMNTIFKRG